MGLLEPRPGIGTAVRDRGRRAPKSLGYRARGETKDGRGTARRAQDDRAAFAAQPAYTPCRLNWLIWNKSCSHQAAKIRRGRHHRRRGLGVPLRNRAGDRQHCGLESGRRADGPAARDSGTIVTGGRTATKVARRSPPNSVRSEEGRRSSRRGCHAPAPAGN